MKIVKIAEFLQMPAGTLFAKYEPYVFGELCIKGDSIPNTIDFFYQDIVGAIDAQNSSERVDVLFEAQETGKSIPLELDCQGRDACYETEQLFAVWERADVLALIARLQMTVDEPRG